MLFAFGARAWQPGTTFLRLYEADHSVSQAPFLIFVGNQAGTEVAIMKLMSLLSTVPRLTALASSSPVPTLALEQRQACTIKIVIVDEWVEAALSRYRLQPSIYGEAWDILQELNDHWGTDAFLSRFRIEQYTNVVPY